MKKSLLVFVRIVLCVIFIFPLYYAFINSFSSVYSSTSMWPKSFHPENYYYAVTLIPFFKYLLNSLIIVLITMVMGVFLNFMYGYAFSRLEGRGKTALFTVTISLMMIPGFAISIPQYIFLNLLGIKNSFWIYVILGLAGSPYTIFLYRQYLLTFPKEIEEAAIVDGCGYFGMIVHFYLPLCKAVVIIVAFSMFMASWGDYMTPFMFLSESKYPLAIALFNSTYTMPGNPELKMTPVVLAAAMLMMIPSVIMFFLCQKSLVGGVIEGSVKA